MTNDKSEAEALTRAVIEQTANAHMDAMMHVANSFPASSVPADLALEATVPLAELIAAIQPSISRAQFIFLIAVGGVLIANAQASEAFIATSRLFDPEGSA